MCVGPCVIVITEK